MYERFTEDARRAIQAANQEATRRGHDFISIEHVLLGILAHEGLVADACRALGVQPASVVQTLGTELDQGRLPIAGGSVKRVIELAIAASNQRGHQAIATDHIIIAITQAASPELIQAIEKAGLPMQELCIELLRRHPTGPPAHTSPPLATLVNQLQHDPDIRRLDQQLAEIEEKQGAAIARCDFDEATRLRDEKVSVRQRLTELIERMLGDSDRNRWNDPPAAHSS